jgi:hypothetical protein
MAEDNKGYITYAKEQGVSESKAKEYWEEASASVKKETNKTKEELNDADWKHIFGVFKSIIINSKKKESISMSKRKIINESADIDFEKIWEYKDKENYDLISVYQSQGGKSTLAILDNHKYGTYEIKEFDRSGRGGMSGGSFNYDQLLAEVANKYIDTPSYECIYGDELSGDVILYNRWYYSIDDPRVKKMSDEQYEACIRHIELNKRGRRDLFEVETTLLKITTKSYIIEGNIINKNSKIIIEGTPNTYEPLQEHRIVMNIINDITSSLPYELKEREFRKGQRETICYEMEDVFNKEPENNHGNISIDIDLRQYFISWLFYSSAGQKIFNSRFLNVINNFIKNDNFDFTEEDFTEFFDYLEEIKKFSSKYTISLKESHGSDLPNVDKYAEPLNIKGKGIEKIEMDRRDHHLAFFYDGILCGFAWFGKIAIANYYEIFKEAYSRVVNDGIGCFTNSRPADMFVQLYGKEGQELLDTAIEFYEKNE